VGHPLVRDLVHVHPVGHLTRPSWMFRWIAARVAGPGA
jgi:hypothetical protein